MGRLAQCACQNHTEVLFHRVLTMVFDYGKKSKNSVSSNMQMVYMLIRLTVNEFLKDFLNKED